MVIASLISIATGAGISVARSSPEAVQHVEAVAARFLNVVGSHGSINNRCKDMRVLLESSVDLESIAREAAHIHWATLSEQQQGSLREALAAYVTADVSSVLGLRRGEALRVLSSVEEGEVTIVKASLDLNDHWSRSMQMSWSVASLDGEQKIIDIEIGGASFLASQRKTISTLFDMTNGDVDTVILSLQDGAQAFPNCANGLEPPS